MNNSVAKNVIVNFFGRSWGALLSIVLTPIYIKFLGMEAYGLIGIFITIQSLLGILDMGLGTAANREIAVLSVCENGTAQMRDMIRTLEWIYWGVAIFIAFLIGMLSYPIAHFWVNATVLHADEINTAIVLMGIVIAVQWPSGLYGGALMGLQQQMLLNTLTTLFSTVRALGAVFVLWKISSSIIAFFVWQAINVVFQTFFTAFYLWRCVKQINHKPIYNKKYLLETRKFAAEMSAITLMAVVFMQLDKVILSKLLTLESFSYYYAASVAAGSLYIFISPIFNAVFPRFSQLVSQHQSNKVKDLFDQASQLMGIVILSLMIVLVFFSYDLLLLWTHSKVVAENGFIILGLLAIGNSLNGVMNVPYALQLATGDVKSILKINVCLIAISTPLIIVLAKFFGGVGAAASWIIYTLSFLIINTIVINNKFEYLNTLEWIWSGLIKPSLIALIVVSIGYSIRKIIDPNQWIVFTIICLTAVTSILTVVSFTPSMLSYIKGYK